MKKIAVFVQEGSEGEKVAYVVDAARFQLVNGCETYTETGITIGCYDAGCNVLDESTSPLVEDCKKALREKFNIPEDAEFEIIEAEDDDDYHIVKFKYSDYMEGELANKAREEFKIPSSVEFDISYKLSPRDYEKQVEVEIGFHEEEDEEKYDVAAINKSLSAFANERFREIDDFVNEYADEHEEHVTCLACNYHDGHNWQTVTAEYDGDGEEGLFSQVANGRLLTESEDDDFNIEEIIEEYDQNDDWEIEDEHGMVMETEHYVFRDHQADMSAWYAAEVTVK
jgi:bifunctional DNA-binding transcriptional regulator/antitoxin component of YhaV-PrlF toxin-antitoxin module